VGNYGGNDWMDGLGESQGSSRMPAGLTPGGGTVVNNFYGASNMATPQMLGTGGSGPGQLQGILMMLGSIFPQIRGILPTGGHFSPMGYAQYSQQQADMMQVMGAGNEIDKQQFAAMASRLNSMSLGTGNAMAVTAANQAQASTILGVLNNPVLQQFTQAFPEVQRMVDMFNPMQGTSQQMAQQLYMGTRHLGTSVGDVNAMTTALSERYQVQYGASKNLINQSFAHGLNQREIGEAAGAAFKSYVLDPEQIRGGDAQAQNKFTDTIEKYNAVGGSLRDIFGPQGSMTQLFQNLNQMTAGGISQMDPGSLVTMVDKMKAVSMNAGVSLQGMQAVMATGAMYGSQMGMPGAAGAQIGLDATMLTGIALKSRDQSPVWGQADPNQIGNEVSGAMFGIATSSQGIAAMGLLRLDATIQKSGATYTGADKTSYDKLQGLTRAIRMGSLTKGQIAQLEDVHGLAGWAGDLIPGGRQAASEWLTNQRYNSEYQNEFARGSLSIMRNNLEKETVSALGYNASVGDLATKMNVTKKEAGTLVWNTLLTGGKSEKERLEALTGLLGDKLGLDSGRAGVAAESLYTGVKGTLWNWGAPGKFGMDQAQAKDDMIGGIEMHDRQMRNEAIGRATGLGSQGEIGARLMAAITGKDAISSGDFAAGLLGAPNKAARENLLKQLGASKQVDAAVAKGNLVRELQVRLEKGETTLSRDGDLWGRLQESGAIPEEMEGAENDPSITDVQGALGASAVNDLSTGRFGILGLRGEEEEMAGLLSELKRAAGKGGSVKEADAALKAYQTFLTGTRGGRLLKASEGFFKGRDSKYDTAKHLERVAGLGKVASGVRGKEILDFIKETGQTTSAVLTGEVDDAGLPKFDLEGKRVKAATSKDQAVTINAAGSIVVNGDVTVKTGGGDNPQAPGNEGGGGGF